MRMMDELKPLYLYSANKKVYAPIDEKDKRKNSAILLLTPSLESSSQLMRLPYLYNPNLFTSFYVDRNVMAYIGSTGVDNIKLDEKEEEAVSEAMVGNWASKCTFEFDDKTSMMDMRYIQDVYNKKTVEALIKKINMHKVPEKIKVVVHPTVSSLRESAPKRVRNMFEDKFYSYSDKNEIHLLSKFVYDPERMCGPYENYLKAELLDCILILYNPDLPLFATMGIALALSGADNWVRDNENTIDKDTIWWKWSYTTKKLIKRGKINDVIKYIKTGDIKIYYSFVGKNTMNFIAGLIFESELSYFDRQRLLPSEFGIPEKRKYPMPDEDHVRAAVRMFNNCDPDDEEELAKAIIKKMKKFGITDIKVSAANRFKKYYHPEDEKKHEATLMELASIPDNKIVVGTDFHFVGYDDNQKNIIIKPKSYIEGIIKKQNELVGNDGIFIFLGDLLYKGFHTEYEIPREMKSEVIKYIKRFKGKYKILIRGNHDNLPDEFYINTLGFTHVCSSLTYGNIVFTHQPEIVSAPKINIHGHIHGSRMYVEKKPINYADVYAIGGKNLRMATLPDILAKQEEYEKTIKQGTSIDRVDPHMFIDGESLDLDSVVTESFVDSDYADIMKICSHLSQDELKRITFYDTYRNSQFVVRRIIARSGGEPVGFIDAYQFPSRPELMQLVIAVDNRYHGQGIGGSLLDALMNSKLEDDHEFDMYYWTAHPDNDASINIALKHGFTDTCHMDKYGRNIYIKMANGKSEETVGDLVPAHLKPSSQYGEAFVANESCFVTEDLALFSEAGDESQYSSKLRRYLYKERIKNNKMVIEIYDRVKAMNPELRKMYLKIKMYKHLNVFIDLSYYHSLFLQNITYKLDKAVNFYFDFINRLINNPEIDTEYKKKTIFIPIDAGIWPQQPGSDIWDFKKNLNPISIIFRLIRTNPGGLRRAWGNKSIVFVGSRGYFTIDFKSLDLRNLSRLKNNIKKLMSMNEPIEDEYEADDIAADSTVDGDISQKRADSKKAMANKMIDKIEKATDIKIDDVSFTSVNNSTTSIKAQDIDPKSYIGISHLGLEKNGENVYVANPGVSKMPNGIVVISIDPDGPDGYNKLKGTGLEKITFDTYCMPK